jgi:hypothetical protein
VSNARTLFADHLLSASTIATGGLAETGRIVVRAEIFRIRRRRLREVGLTVVLAYGERIRRSD